MKKSVLILLLFIVLKTTAQTIPNADFENWTAGVPNGWGTYFPTIAVTQSNDKQNGLSSVKFTMDQTFGVSILATNNGNLLATNTISTFLNGYIKASLNATDSFLAEAYYIRNSDQVEAGGADVTILSRSVWTPFHITLLKPTGFTPDSFGIVFAFNAISSSSYVMIDNLAFSNTAIGNELGSSISVGIKNISKQTINSSIYPNPANGNAEIDFSLTSSSSINIKIYDVTGRLINTVLNEMRSSGVQKIQVNTEGLQNGIYFYTITGDGFNETKKFVVNR